jgi:cephalosporin-C deacetylase-like acetyl esterase
VYHGYSGRAARPLDLLAMASQGMCVLSVDTRGQNGQSQDAAVYPEGHAHGWMTAGIRNPKTY